MQDEFHQVIEWLRTQDHGAAFTLMVENGVPDGTAHELLEPVPRPAWLDQAAPLVPLDLLQQTRLIRAVLAIGWRPIGPQDGPLQSFSVRATVDERDFRHPQQLDYLAAKMAIQLATDLLDKGYLRLEADRSGSRMGEVNLQLVFREPRDPKREQYINWPARWRK